MGGQRAFHWHQFTPKSDRFQISPAASLNMLHHTVWRIWLFIAYSGEWWFYYQFSLPHSYISSWKGWEDVYFELRSERVNGSTMITYPAEVRNAVSRCNYLHLLKGCYWSDNQCSTRAGRSLSSSRMAQNVELWERTHSHGEFEQ